jgi:hypothetical protein
MEDAAVPARNGLFGKIDPAMVALACNIATNSTNIDLTKFVIGGSTATDFKIIFPWDGATVPGAGTDQFGIQF